jgi:hypothetical protein
MSSLLSQWRYIGVCALALFLIVVWILLPVPTAGDLTEVEGALVSYSIESKNVWYKSYSRPDPVYVLFKVSGVDGRFWNEAVNPDNAKSIFPHAGAHIKLYRVTHYRFLKINGDGEKSYGLVVDGSEIQPLNSALRRDAIDAHFILPILAVLLLLQAGWAWRRWDRRVGSSSGSGDP